MDELGSDGLQARFLFLLERAGDCRACELAEFVGVTTHEAAGCLARMKAAGLVTAYPFAATEKWRLAPGRVEVHQAANGGPPQAPPA